MTYLRSLLQYLYDNRFLYSAYTATWVIHIAYLGTLVRRYGRLRNEIEELKQK